MCANSVRKLAQMRMSVGDVRAPSVALSIRGVKTQSRSSQKRKTTPAAR